MQETLKTRPAKPVVIAVTLVALLATAVVWLIMRADEAAMQAAGGHGIVDYELAFTTERAEAILLAWGPAGQAAARHSLWVDYGFMPSYGLLFAGITLLIARGVTGKWQAAGLTLTPAPLAAAALDAIENVMLLITLGGASPAPVLVAGVCASIKFGLLMLVLLFWIIGGAAWFIGPARPR